MRGDPNHQNLQDRVEEIKMSSNEETEMINASISDPTDAGSTSDASSSGNAQISPAATREPEREDGEINESEATNLDIKISKALFVMVALLALVGYIAILIFWISQFYGNKPANV